MELIWSAHEGKHLIVSGFVHPPTENRHIQALKLLGENNLIMVKGLEGGIDIPNSRISTITKCLQNRTNKLKVDPSDFSCKTSDLKFENLDSWRSDSFHALAGKGPLYKPLIWNAGVYFWLSGVTKDISSGIEKAQLSIHSGSAISTLQRLIAWRNA